MKPSVHPEACGELILSAEVIRDTANKTATSQGLKLLFLCNITFVTEQNALIIVLHLKEILETFDTGSKLYSVARCINEISCPHLQRYLNLYPGFTDCSLLLPSY